MFSAFSKSYNDKELSTIFVDVHKIAEWNAEFKISDDTIEELRKKYEEDVDTFVHKALKLFNQQDASKLRKIIDSQSKQFDEKGNASIQCFGIFKARFTSKRVCNHMTLNVGHLR